MLKARRAARAGTAIGPLVPALFGMTFTLLFNLALFMVQPDVLESPWSPSHALRIVACVTFVVLAALSRRGLSLLRRRGPVIDCALASSLGVLLIYLAGVLRPSAEGLYLVGIVLAEGGYCALFLGWVELLARLSMDFTLLYYIVARIFAAGVRTLLGMSPVFADTATCPLACLCPLASALCLFAGTRALARLPYAQGETPQPRWSFPWRPVMLVATFSLAMQLAIDTVSPQRVIPMAGSLIACLLVLVVVVTQFRRFNLRATHYVSLPLLLAGLLCAMLGDGWSGYAVNLCFAANDVFLAFAYALLFDLAYRRGVNPLWTFGITQAGLTLGIIASHRLSATALPALAEIGQENALFAALILVVTVAFMVFLTDADYANAWGMRSGADGDGTPAVATSLEAACAAMARRYGLTRREEEILLLRLGGATHRALEDGLSISENTVKTHVRHIYQKLGVKTLDEARELVEGAR